MNSWREECAVFGVWGDEEAARLTYLGLYALQHRGQESTGIVSLDQGRHWQHKGLGLVGEVFKDDILNTLKGTASVGHNRYSTTGENLLTNAQPLCAMLQTGPIAIAHNGNITNAAQLRRQLISEGAIFQGTNDTEVLLHLLARHPSQKITECLKDILPRIEGAFSLVILTQNELIAVRDAYGFRPLVLGQRQPHADPLSQQKKMAYFLASETCAFDLIGAELVREILPREILSISHKGLEQNFFSSPVQKTAHCVFEAVYFSRPDSIVFGESVYATRKELGRRLAQECPAPGAEIVVPVPDSGVPAALGYAQESLIPFEMGIIRNHYVGRTFIQPTPSVRSFGVKIKLNPQISILKNKSIVVVDDSIVRGTTSKKIIQLLRQTGAREVHFRIAAPPTTGPCYYGVDTPSKDQLIAAHQSIEDIRRFIEADTLGYLSVEGLRKAAKETESRSFCSACFDGQYPVLPLS